MKFLYKLAKLVLHYIIRFLDLAKPFLKRIDTKGSTLSSMRHLRISAYILWH